MKADGRRRPPGPNGGSIRTRLALAMTLTALVSVALAAVVAASLIRQSSRAAALSELRSRAEAITSRPAFLRRQPEQGLRLLRRALNLSGASLYEIGPGESVTLLSGEDLIRPSAGEIRKLASGESVEGTRRDDSREMVFVAQPVAGARAALVLSRPASETSALPFAGRLLAAALVASAAAVVISVYFSRRIARPLADLAGAASDIARGDFSRRVQTAGADEIAMVADSFNRMAGELGDADLRQREFFLSISHELRTPLTAIKGYAEAIEDGIAKGSESKSAASIIVRESNRLTRLVSDLLDLARIDAKRFKVSTDKVELAPMLHQLQENFGPKAAEDGVTLEVEEVEGEVQADRDRLIQVLSNLVENALRYTPVDGRITLSASCEPSGARIEVTDTGPGFEKEDLPRAFDPQYLWSKYRGRESGTGLGLAISRELVEAMGGRVGAAAVPTGRGACFWVELPAPL